MTETQRRTLASLRRIGDSPLFVMDYACDYRLDDFMRIGADSDSQLNRFIVTHLLGGAPMVHEMPDMGCSTYAGMLASGERIFGRNFDEQDCLLLVLTTHPTDGYASISVVNLSYIGITARSLPLTPENHYFLLAAPYVPLDGVNEKGLAVGVLKIRNTPTSQQRGNISVTTTSAMRIILDRCATVDEAINLLLQFDMHSSANVDFHFHLADSSGGSAIVEYVHNDMKIVRHGCATNFLLTPDTGVQGSGHDRYEILRQALHENSGEFRDIPAAMRLLQAVSGGSTRWSAVYNLTKPALWLAVGRRYEELKHFELLHDPQP